MEIDTQEVLEAVRKKQPTNLSEIANHLDLHPKLVHDVLKKLEKNNKIQRKVIGEEHIYYTK